MTIALKSENGDFIYFDVVTQYSQNFPSQISQHPVDGAGVISDHVIKHNPRMQITALISGADFNSTKPDLIAEDRTLLGVNNVVSLNEVATPITVSYDRNPNNLFPDVIGQLFTDTLPEISGIVEGRNSSYSEKVIFTRLQQFYVDKVRTTVYEFDEGTIVEEILDMYITNISAKESSENGDALVVTVSLEQAQITSLLEEELPEDAQESFQERSAERVSRGGQSDEDGSENTNSATTGSALSTFLGG